MKFPKVATDRLPAKGRHMAEVTTLPPKGLGPPLRPGSARITLARPAIGSAVCLLPSSGMHASILALFDKRANV